jgi:hypothetical protein
MLFLSMLLCQNVKKIPSWLKAAMSLGGHFAITWSKSGYLSFILKETLHCFTNKFGLYLSLRVKYTTNKYVWCQDFLTISCLKNDFENSVLKLPKPRSGQYFQRVKLEIVCCSNRSCQFFCWQGWEDQRKVSHKILFASVLCWKCVSYRVTRLGEFSPIGR